MSATALNFETSTSKRQSKAFVDELARLVGRRHVLTNPSETALYRKGFRFGSGRALAVVRPGSLVEQWKVLLLCVLHKKIVLMQASNTGLTGGSTPDGDEYDREIVIISTRRMAKIQLIDGGHQVICLPGATLDQLEKELKPLNRDPHSVIGSSCIGASVFGGVSNNSGGALIHRGPAYTQMALFACVTAEGTVELVNHLGIELGANPEEMLGALENKLYKASDIDLQTDLKAHDDAYASHVREVDADTPARFNADPSRLYEASGSAGKVMTFAVRLDTFEKPASTQVFYVGTNDPQDLTKIRRDMLTRFNDIPISAEYLHRTAFDIAEKYGKDTFLAIQYLGTSSMPKLFAMKARFDSFASSHSSLPHDLSDRLMQFFASLFPKHLPKRMRDYRNKFEHHLLIRTDGNTTVEARDYLKSLFPSGSGDFFECTHPEGEKAFLHRFAAAGAANRYRAIHRDEISGLVALDIALCRNDRSWVEKLPPELDSKIEHKLYYGHFFCHVFHQDYIAKKGVDPVALEHQMWDILDERGAQYPAEHNFGHLYKAKQPLAAHYRSLDPKNMFNPGIGGCTKCVDWR